ncbi:hypothetical protein CRE_14009 [Caenorhabditis remanei]|uniref:Uncharacterized protein n=1 Tax=Caenorhabditis remanei TaxID=31234 RepID=E3M8S9_CAERE|nr:hypothetical protein CRE_14009 [Caenorhabditis remanei]
MDAFTYRVHEKSDIKRELVKRCQRWFEDRPWYEYVANWAFHKLMCVDPVKHIRENCIKHMEGSSCDWWIRLALEEFCNKYGEFYECNNLPTIPPPRSTTVSTSTTTTTASTTTTRKTTTESNVTNMIMFGTIGASIMFLLFSLVLYLAHRRRQIRKEKEEAANWGFDWMGSSEEDSKNSGSTGSGWGTGWTSTAKGTTGTTKTKKDKKTKKTGASTKTDTTGTWL